MIRTRLTVRVSDDFSDYIEDETQKQFPGSFLVKDRYDDKTHEWVFQVCFENDADYTFFLLKWKR